MTTNAKFDPLRDYDEVHGIVNGPLAGSAYRQEDRNGRGHYFNGDRQYVGSDPEPHKREAADSPVTALIPGTADRLRDVQNRAMVAEPMFGNLPGGNLSDAERMRLAVITELQANGVQVRDDGSPGDPNDDADKDANTRRLNRARGGYRPVLNPDAEDASEAAALADAEESERRANGEGDTDQDGDTDAADTEPQTQTPEEAYGKAKPEKAFKAWLKGELNDPKPTTAQWRGWATEVLGASYPNKAEIIAAAVAAGVVKQEDVKV